MKATIEARRLYQDSALQGATPIELVILLYDSALHDLQGALMAMKAADVETRSHQVAHALMVLQQLQGTLDFERGGAAARQFEQFYNLLRAKILEAQMRGSTELMQQQIQCVTEVRDSWVEAKRRLEPLPLSHSAPAGNDPGADQEARSGWSA